MWPFSRKAHANAGPPGPRSWPFSADPTDYGTAFRAAIRQIYMKDLPDDLLETEVVRKDIEDHVYHRMTQALNTLIPWVAAHRDIGAARILEIGCGTGSASAALAVRGAQIESIDISGASVECARRRLDLLGLADRVRLSCLPADWTASAARMPAGDPNRRIFSQRYDIVILFATLEHMTIAERLDCLALAWSLLVERGIMVTLATPNRLFPYDWHTSWEMFTQALPDELALRFAPTCKRQDYAHAFAETDVNNPSPADCERLYRWGRGLSYHEFELAIGLKNLRVLDDGRNRLVARPYLDTIGYAKYVRRNFRKFKTEAPLGFFLPSVDLILEKPAGAA